MEATMIKCETNYGSIQHYMIGWANFPKLLEQPHVQAGIHPFVVVSNNDCNKHSPVVTVIQITSKDSNPWLPTHYTLDFKQANEVGLYKKSVIKAESITSIGKSIILRMNGILTEDAQKEVDRIIRRQLGL